MRRALRLRSTRVALVVATLTGVGLCFSPLTGVPGVESALVLGILLPPFVAAVGARYVASIRRDGVHVRASRILGRSVGTALLVLAVPVAILLLDTLRIRSCNPVEGLAFLVLGPGIGVCLAAAVGATVAAWVPRPRLATTVAVLFPIAGIVLGLHRFWDSPAIFVYAHFVGWFPGTLYDEGIFIPVPYLSFRALSLAIGASLFALLSATWEAGLVRARLGRLRARPARAAAGLALLFAVIVADGFAPQLGHAGSAEHIAEELGATREGERCIVHAPRELPPSELQRLSEDCDYRVRIAEADLGVRQDRKVTAFFFRNPEEKQRFMGAAHTFIAKPWRDEVYLQLRGWPHPVLHHELVHVVAGNAAEGPFRVGGQAGGWIPDPALIEGVAVALAWEERDGLTPHQWARAMRELELMPSMEQVMGLSFLGQPPRNAYTAAGSFVRHLLDTHGAKPLRRAYRTGDIAAAYGKPIAELEREWLAFLDTVDVPEDAMALAELRFSRQSIFSAVCPHRVADLRGELAADVAAGDATRAIRTCEDILDIDPADVQSRATCVGALAWDGQWEEAQEQLSVLAAEPPAPAPVRVAARQGLADALWRRGDRDRALEIYRELLDEPQTDDAARQIEVRVIGLEAGGRESELVFDLLVGADGRPASPAEAVHVARELSWLRDGGLGPYLEARQLMAVGRYDLAVTLTDDALARGLPTRRLREEARRMLGTSLYAAGDHVRSRRVWRAVLSDPEASAGDRLTAADWLRRIRLADATPAP